MLREIRKLDRRIEFLNNAIFLSVASAILVSLAVVLLFSAQLFGAPMGTPAALLLFIAMLLMISALCTFIVKIRLMSSTIHTTHEVPTYRGDTFPHQPRDHTSRSGERQSSSVPIDEE